MIEKMQQAFRRSEELLDLEMQGNGTKPKEQADISKSTNTQPAQLVVTLDRVESLVLQGWRFVGALPNNKAVFENFGGGKRDV